MTTATTSRVKASNIHFTPFCLRCKANATAECYNENHAMYVGSEIGRQDAVREYCVHLSCPLDEPFERGEGV